MTIAMLSPTPPSTIRLKRFTVSEYDRMIRDATLAESDRLELLDGWIVEKMPHNAPHDSAVLRLQRRLTRLFGDDWLIRVQSSITMDKSVPEPDIAAVPGPESRFDETRPTAKDVVLAVEVSESSLPQDQGFKRQLYARNKVPLYWIVNLIDRRVEVYTEPRGGKNPTYRRQTNYNPGEDVPVVVAGKRIGRIPVNELLP